MPGPISFSSMAMLALAGTALGVHLGKSAINQINPAYFSSPEPGTRFHADLVPGGAGFDWDDAASVFQAALPTDLGSGCIRCPPPVDLADPLDASLADYAGLPSDYVAIVRESVPDDDYAAPARIATADSEMIERYAHYKVSEEEEEEPAPATALSVADEEAGSQDGCGDSCEAVAPPAS